MHPAVITGFNTNVRYRGRMYHVQTEDSGRKNPHIISHLYYAGIILASEKSGYDEHLAAEDLDSQVRERMEAQHKSMLERLKAKEFDAVIAERLGGETAEGSTTSPSITDVPPLEEEPAGAAEGRPAAAVAAGGADRAFGEGIISQKPLDEVILEYLVQKARDRSSSTARPAERRPRESRSKG